MTRQILDLPPAVLEAYGFTSEPGGTKAMLLLREGFGHHTETLDLADFSDWLAANRPELIVAGHKPGENFDLVALEPDVLKEILAYARLKRGERDPNRSKILQLGHLMDPSKDPFCAYMNAGTWKQGAAVGTVKGGKLRIANVPVSQKQ